jgi:hypothetical protein
MAVQSVVKSRRRIVSMSSECSPGGGAVGYSGALIGNVRTRNLRGSITTMAPRSSTGIISLRFASSSATCPVGRHDGRKSIVDQEPHDACSRGSSRSRTASAAKIRAA